MQQFTAGFGAAAALDPGHVMLHRLRREEQPRRHLTIGESGHDQLGHLALTSGQFDRADRKVIA